MNLFWEGTEKIVDELRYPFMTNAYDSYENSLNTKFEILIQLANSLTKKTEMSIRLF